MKKNQALKAVTALMMAFILMFALVGCGGDAKAEEEYKQAVADISTEVQVVFTSFSSTLTTLDPTDPSAQETVDQMMDDMESAFEKFAALKAPDKYKEVQDLINEASEKALEGLSIIRTELKSVFSGESTGDTAKLQEGSQLLLEAATKLQEAGEKGSEIDNQ